MPNKSDTLLQLFGKIHNHIYANEGLSPFEALDEFVKALFLKLELEMEDGQEILQSTNIWHRERGRIPDGEFKNEIDAIFERVKRNYPGIFKERESIGLKESTLAYTMESLQKVALKGTDRDDKGTAFQKFVFSSLRGDRGQFLTPDPVVDLVVNMVKPSRESRIIDPACGAGGFLVRSLRYVKNKEVMKTAPLSSNYVGIETSPSMMRLARIRMILEGDNNSRIINADGLWDFGNSGNCLPEEFRNGFDFVLTNPPFGSRGRISELSYLERFQFGRVWERVNDGFTISGVLQKAQVPEILFIERSMELAKDGGKVAIVLPDGILENKIMGYVRRYLMENFQIVGVVSLPSKTFIPHGTGVKTSVLLMKKTGKDELKRLENEDYRIFFSIVENIGYRGDKNATPLFRQNRAGENVPDEDMSEVVRQFTQFEAGMDPERGNIAFTRKFSEIGNRLDAEFYKPDYKKLVDALISRGAPTLGELVEIKSGKSPVMRYPDEYTQYVEITNVNAETSEIVGSQRMRVSDLPGRATYEIRKGEVITAVAGVSTGTEKHASAIVTKEYDGAVCTNGFRVLKPMKIDKHYLLYYLRTEWFLAQVRRYLTGAAIPSILDEDLSKIYVLLPTKDKLDLIINSMKDAQGLRESASEKMKILRAMSLVEDL